MSRIRPWIVAVVVAGCAYLMLANLIHSMTFYPSRYPAGQWDLQERLRADDVEMKSQDGLRLHAWLVPAQGESLATTLYFHGNAGNLSDRPGHLQALTAAGSEVLIVDYRGYGKSEGEPSENNLYEDAETAYDWLLAQGRKPERIVLYGESLGTAVATDLASKRPCGALILEAPFPSRSAVAGLILPILGPLIARGFETARKIANVKCPVFVMHGTADTVIPQALGRAVFDAAPEPKTFWSIPGGRHIDPAPMASEEYRARMRKIFEALPAP